MIAVLGFTTILGAFSGTDICARLACGQVVLDVSFNPTYGLSLKSYTNSKSKCYNQSVALNELSNYKLPVLVTYGFGISISSLQPTRRFLTVTEQLGK